jgi:hypothetical protein
MSDPKSISEAIQGLAGKKHVVSEEAKTARKELGKKDKQHNDKTSIALQKKLALVQEFEESVNLLSIIFQRSRFDEFVAFISNPTKMLTINLLIGLLRGIGFAVGFILIVVFVGYLIKQSIPPQYLELISIAMKAML